MSTVDSETLSDEAIRHYVLAHRRLVTEAPTEKLREASVALLVNLEQLAVERSINVEPFPDSGRRYLDEIEMTSEDWRKVHAARNVFALTRRKGLSKARRAALKADADRLFAELRERGIDEALLRQWRAYPARGEGRDLSFGLAATAHEEAGPMLRIAPPPSEADLKRRRRPAEPDPISPAEYMGRIEHAIRTVAR